MRAEPGAIRPLHRAVVAVLSFETSRKIFVAPAATDMRKLLTTLAAQIKHQ